MTAKTSSLKQRIWFMRLLAMVFIPILILGGIELGLRVAGYGHDTHYFRRIQIQGQNFYVPNEAFTDWFFPPAIARPVFPVRMPVNRSNNSYRIFLFGESAAEGDPDPTYGMGRYLQVLLQERYPGIHFEVVCVAITAIDSNAILQIARDCARRQGDLWVVYMGNNEMVGPFGAETSYGSKAPPLGMIRAVLAIKTTRTGQLLDNLIRGLRSKSSIPKKWGGMEMFMNGRLGYDDPARLRAYANFSGNLEDILRTAHRAGVPVILSTVAVNLKDCAPFASVHTPGLRTNELSEWGAVFEEGVTNEAVGAGTAALVCYKRAAEIDPKFAELQFRMGNCNLELTNWIQANQDFNLARDYDALDFRADTRINSTIRGAAARHAKDNVYLVDAAQILAQNSPDGIPGLDFFYEHVHLNFAGNYLLALNFAKKIKELLPSSITAHDKGSWASEELCECRLAVTVWDRQRVWQPIFGRITAPPFTGQFDHELFLKKCQAKLNQAKGQIDTQTSEQALQIYEDAVALAPDDVLLVGNFEQFLEARGDLAKAIAEAERGCELMPQFAGACYYTGNLLIRAGNVKEATNYFFRAVTIQNDYAQAQTALGEVFANQQKTADAVRWFGRAIRSSPNYVETYLALGFLEQDQGKTAEAMVNFQKAADLEPEGPADYFNRANLAADKYRWDEAISDLQAVVKVEPEFWQAHYLLGIQLAANGEPEEAQKELSQAVHYRPDFAPAHLYLGITLAAQKKPTQALAEFRRVLQLDPANSAAQQEITVIQALGKASDNSDQIASPAGRLGK